MNTDSRSPETSLIWQPKNEFSPGKTNEPTEAAQLAAVGEVPEQSRACMDGRVAIDVWSER